MKKILLVLLVLVGCGDVDNLDNLRQAACANDSSKCEGTSWSINVTLSNFPEKISMNLNGNLVLNECSNSNSAFRVSRNSRNEIYSSDYELPGQNALSLRIYNCSTNQTFYWSPNQNFSFKNKRVTISI